MPPRKKTEPVLQPEQLDIFSNLSDDDLIAEKHAIDDQIKDGQTRFDEWKKPRAARIAQILAALAKRLDDRKADSTRTDHGTAYFSTLMNTKIEQPGALFDFVAENWDSVGADVSLALKVDAVRSYMEENDGKPPPGMSVSYYRRLNCNRS